MSKWPENEVELCKPLIWWLQDLKWTVYQEVQIEAFGAIADIIAVRDGIVWVIEAKRSLSLDLLAQAVDWAPYANFVSIATPVGKTKLKRSRRLVFEILKNYGIGHLKISQTRFSSGLPGDYEAAYDITQAPEAKLNRAASRGEKWILNTLTEEHKTFAEAGNSYGRRYSPFQATCLAVARFVKKSPGATLKETIEGIDHHYANEGSARCSLAKWITRGKVAGVESRIKKGKTRLYLIGETNEQNNRSQNGQN